MKLTYRQAYDRIVDAYFKNELNPFKDCACFIGNLLGDSIWGHCRNYIASESQLKEGNELISSFGYTLIQIGEMEDNFLNVIIHSTTRHGKQTRPRSFNTFYIDKYGGNYEDALFDAMSSTLDMLKKIHEDNGEIIDAPVFKKRIVTNQIKINKN